MVEVPLEKRDGACGVLHRCSIFLSISCKSEWLYSREKRIGAPACCIVDT